MELYEKYIPIEIINEIISRIPIKKLYKATLINRFFRDASYKRISPIRTSEAFNKACLTGDYLSLSTFLPFKSNVKVSWDNGLMKACEGGHFELARFLMEKKVITIRGYNKGLIKAGLNGHLELVKLMIEGIPGGPRADCNFNCAFYYACKGGYLEIVKYLNLILINQNRAIDYDWGLWGACEGCHIEIALFLIKSGATDFNGALIYACRFGYLELAKLMINPGRGPKIGADNFNRGLFEACEGKHWKVAELMIEQGATECRGCNTTRAANFMEFLKSHLDKS